MRNRRYQTSTTAPDVLGIVASMDEGSNPTPAECKVQSGFNLFFNHFRNHEWLRKVVRPEDIDLWNPKTHILSLVFGSMEAGARKLDLAQKPLSGFLDNGFSVSPTERAQKEIWALNAAWRLAVLKQKQVLFSMATFEPETRIAN